MQPGPRQVDPIRSHAALVAGLKAGRCLWTSSQSMQQPQSWVPLRRSSESKRGFRLCFCTADRADNPLFGKLPAWLLTSSVVTRLSHAPPVPSNSSSGQAGATSEPSCLVIECYASYAGSPCRNIMLQQAWAGLSASGTGRV